MWYVAYMDLDTLRRNAIDVLTTHRHGEQKDPCKWCAKFYGDLFDKIAPLIQAEADCMIWEELETIARYEST